MGSTTGKKRIYIQNHGVFNMFGYSNIKLPAVLELTEEQCRWLNSNGYQFQEFSQSGFGGGYTPMQVSSAPEIQSRITFGNQVVLTQAQYDRVLEMQRHNVANQSSQNEPTSDQ
jgi:hypothetical protein